MAKEMVSVGIGNEKATNLEVDIVKLWEPKRVTALRDTTFFKSEDTYYSMKTIDFKKIFNK